MSNFYKTVESTISAKQETSTFKNVSGMNVPFIKCDRTDLSSKETNYFSSFNLPYEYDSLSSGSTIATTNPELYQLNVDEIVIIPINNSLYNEIIDGRSITLTVPQNDAVAGMSAKTVVSSTYSVLKKKQNNVLLGNNVAFLFSDDINKPYTGTTQGQTISHADNTTWNTTSYLQRPAAVSYEDLNTINLSFITVVNGDLNSDQREWTEVKLAVTVSESYPTTFGEGYNYDIPVGFVALDKGYIILTHPDIVDNIPWSGGSVMHYDGDNTAVDDGPNSSNLTTNIYFTSSTVSNLSFYDLNTEFKTAVVCLAMPGEFFMSTNPTWDLEKNLEEYKAGSNNIDSIYPTEIGLYNTNNELIAIAKTDRPIEKKITNIITFNLEIDV